MSNLLRDGLREVISSSYPDTPGAHFAYVGLPLCRDPQRDFVQILEEIVPPQSMPILFVTNEYEAYAHEENHRSQTTTVITFAQFLSALESSLTADGWVSRTHGERRPCLPRDAFIVMDLDPSLPADCALALLGLIQWGIGIEASHSMPILISSIAKHHDLVTDLVRTGDSSRQVPVNNLWEANEYQSPPITHKREPNGDEAFLEAICKDIEANPNKNQLIISFGPSDLADHLRGSLKSLREAKCRFIDVGDWSCSFPVFEEVRSPPPNVTAVMIMVPPNITILPPCFSGYDSVHVILEGCWVDSRTWHDKAGEVAEFMRILPTQHRRMQVWWAAQPGCGETSVWSRRESLAEFVEGGYDDHQLVDCVQLGGFVASVYDAERWGIHPSRTLYNFVGLGHRVKTIKQRLETQGVLSRGQFALHGQEAAIFRKILPLVSYDHCAALFICLDADPIVRGVKIDLTVLLTLGLQLLDVKDREILTELRASDSLFKKLVKCCMGYARSMAANGPMWLELGLWNRVRCLEICPTNHLFSNHERRQSEWNGTFASRLGLDQIALVELEQRRADFRIAIDDLAITSDEQDMRAFNSGVEFDLVQKGLIQAQLFRAYMHHTSISLRTTQAFESHMEHCLLASQLSVERLPSPFTVGQAFSMVSLLNVEGTTLPYICINPDLRVNNGVVYSSNWALMPVDVVEDWMETNHPNGDLVNVLLTRSDGQREDVSEVVDEE